MVTPWVVRLLQDHRVLIKLLRDPREETRVRGTGRPRRVPGAGGRDGRGGTPALLALLLPPGADLSSGGPPCVQAS